ncbi:hypothetical protein MVEN_01171500 [Mycena venus]|uniref:Uncharacterized protein n=1 Tax=Mycena venus TaxID=2733690 RepID=A0A8H6Y5A9_9AGAR|nr:hypothetical protein MVEN_01171500 [Mycena venus]
MSISAELHESQTEQLEVVIHTSSLSGRAEDDTASGSCELNVEERNRSEPSTPDVKITVLSRSSEHPDLPPFKDATRLEEHEMVPDERYKVTDSSVHQRISALEISFAQRIRELELSLAADRKHHTITPWRVLNSILIVGMVTYKAIASYRGQTVGPTTTDWVVGGVWTLIAYWVSFFENSTLGHLSWFFTYNLSGIVVIVLMDVVVVGIFIITLKFN